MVSPAERGLTKIEIPTLIHEKEAFGRRIVGQEEAVGAFAILLAKLHSGIRSQEPGPFDIKFLAGPSGVGKTEIVYTLADLLAEGEGNPSSKVIKLNGGEYQEAGSMSRLLGAPPGYIGSEDKRWPGGTPPVFSQKNLDSHKISYKDNSGRTQSVVIILVDEAEKAHANLHRAFLSVLDKGQMELANNQNTDFSDAVIFYTSNVGNQEVEEARSISDISAETAREMVSESFAAAFPPEFRGRIKDLILFNNLSPEAILKITDMRIRDVERDFASSGITIELDLSQASIDWIAAQGYNPSEGARALKKVIEREVYDKLVLAHVGIGIDRKKIYVDIEKGDPNLSFYFNEGEQLPESAINQVVKPQQKPEQRPSQRTEIRQPDRARGTNTPSDRRSSSDTERLPQQQPLARESEPQLPSRIESDLVNKMRTQGVVYYVGKRDEFVRTGVITAEAANTDEAVRQASAQRILDKMSKFGVNSYIDERDQLVRAGIFREGEANDFEFIRKAGAKRLMDKLRYGMGSFVDERDQLVAAGIGTVEEWNQLLNK